MISTEVLDFAADLTGLVSVYSLDRHLLYVIDDVREKGDWRMDASAILGGILIGVFSGVGTSLLSARAAPHFEHRYWQAERLFEARSATAKELKRLLAEYLAGHIAKDTGQQPDWKPSREFWVAWHAMETDVNTLFSAESRKAVKAAQVLLKAEGGLDMRDDRRRKTDDDFIRAGNDAMRALYEEIGLKLPAA